MKIERLTEELPHPLPPMTPAALAHWAQWEEANHSLEHLQRAVAWLERRRGIVVHAAEFKVTAEELAKGKDGTRRLVLPLAPVVGVSRIEGIIVREDGTPGPGAITGWRVERGVVVLPKEAHGGVVVYVLAGWEVGKVPHLVEMAAARICAFWSQHPEELTAAADGTEEVGDAAHMVDQLLLPFKPSEIGGGA